MFVFFQAEDGIRDLTVTGVQTCALPICRGQQKRCSHQENCPHGPNRYRHVRSLKHAKSFVTLFSPGWREGTVVEPSKSPGTNRSEEHTSELQSQSNLVCRLLLEKKNIAH